MPFTVSHVAAVVPAYRALSRGHVFSAAVIGSMVPDFGFLLLPVSLARWQTHSAAALFSFCLPVGLASYGLLQWLIKPAVLQIMPDRAYLRLAAVHPSQSLSSAATWLYAVIAILLGALTHLIWDGFTHENAHGVLMFPVLDEYGPDLDGHPLQFYHWLQYGSSVIGLFVVAAALALWWRNAPRPAVRPYRSLGPAERQIWSGLYILVPLVVIIWTLLHVHHWVLIHSAIVIGTVAVAAMRGSALSLLLVSALIRLRLTSRNAVAA